MKLLLVITILFLCNLAPVVSSVQKENAMEDDNKAFPAATPGADSLNLSDDVEDYESNIDSSEYPAKIRTVSRNFINTFKRDKDFNYDENTKPAGILDMISAWIDEQIQKLFYSDEFGIFSKYLGYLIALAAVIIVILILRKSKLSGIIYTGASTHSDFSEFTDDISKIDLDNLFNNAVNIKNYRLALRYCYLKMLRSLTEKHIIEWQINKTNYQYLSEIKEDALKKAFSDLTLLFEYIWYGEMPVEEQLFRESVALFNKLNLSLPEKR